MVPAADRELEINKLGQVAWLELDTNFTPDTLYISPRLSFGHIRTYRPAAGAKKKLHAVAAGGKSRLQVMYVWTYRRRALAAPKSDRFQHSPSQRVMSSTDSV